MTLSRLLQRESDTEWNKNGTPHTHIHVQSGCCVLNWYTSIQRGWREIKISWNTHTCTFHDNASGTKEVEKIKVVRSRVHTVSLIPSYIKGLLSSCWSQCALGYILNYPLVPKLGRAASLEHTRKFWKDRKSWVMVQLPHRLWISLGSWRRAAATRKFYLH